MKSVFVPKILADMFTMPPTLLEPGRTFWGELICQCCPRNLFPLPPVSKKMMQEGRRDRLMDVRQSWILILICWPWWRKSVQGWKQGVTQTHVGQRTYSTHWLYYHTAGQKDIQSHITSCAFKVFGSWGARRIKQTFACTLFDKEQEKHSGNNCQRQHEEKVDDKWCFRDSQCLDVRPARAAGLQDSKTVVVLQFNHAERHSSHRWHGRNWAISESLCSLRTLL